MLVFNALSYLESTTMGKVLSKMTGVHSNFSLVH